VRSQRYVVELASRGAKDIFEVLHYLGGIGGDGTEPGQFDVPHGMVMDSDDCLYITDTMNGRIQKFAVG
jgi:hypothetical protein